MAELKLSIGVEVKEAEEALKSFTTNLNKTEASVNKFATNLSNFGRAPLHSIENISKAFLELKKDISNVKFSEIPPVTADIRPAQIALKTLSENAKETSLAVEGISDSAGLINKEINKAIAGIDEVPPINIDVSPAQQALRTLVAGVDRTADQVEALSADIKDSLRVSAIPTIDANIDPAKDKLQQLSNEVKSTTASVAGISERFQKFSNDVNKSLGILSTTSLENFKRKFFDLKQDLSNVTFSALPPVTLDTSKAKQQLQAFQVNVDSAITAVKSDLTDIKITALPPPQIDVRPAEQSLDKLADEARLTGAEISAIADTIKSFSANVNRALGSLPFHNIEAFRQAFLLFKQDLSKITIAQVPPLKIDVDPAVQSLQKVVKEGEKTEAEVSNVSAAFQRFSQSVARSFGALPLSSIAAFRDAFLDFKSDLANVKISTIPPVKVDVSRAENSLQTLTNEAKESGTAVNSLSAQYQRWGGLAAKATAEAAASLGGVTLSIESIEAAVKESLGSVVSDVDQTAAAFQRFAGLLNQSVGALSLKSVEDLRQGVLKLKADLSNITITALPPVEANIGPAIKSIHTLTDELKDSGKAVGGVSGAFDKLNKTVSGLNSDAIKKVELSTASFVKVIKSSEAATKTFGNNITTLQRQVAAFGGGVRAFGVTFDKTLPPALGKIPKASENATNALLNLSRVVQDAPFGFIGIANNLNPLLESFQRLRATTGTTGGALKSLAGSLTGAGGLGIALSVVSSALILFGDELFGAGEKADNDKAKLEALATAIQSVTDNVESLTSALAFQNQLGKINVEIGGFGDIEDLRQQSIAQQQLVVDIQNQILKAKENLNAAITENERQRTEESKKIEEDAFKVVQDLQKKEEDERNRGRIIFRQIALQKIKDQQELNKKLNDDLKDFIERAKRLNDELEKIGFLPPVKFSFFDTFQEELAKAKRVFDDFNSKNLKIKPELFTFPSFSEPQIKDEVKKAFNVVEDGIRTGIIALPAITMKVQLDKDGFVNNEAVISDAAQNFALASDKELKAAFKTLGISMADLINFDETAGFNFSVLVDRLRKGFGAVKNATKEELIGIAKETQKGLDSIGAVLTNIQFQGITTVAEALGTVLAGGDVQNLFKGFAGIIADGLTAIGKELITMSGVIKAVKLALSSSGLNPAALLAGGISLIAIAAALRSALNRGIQGFAAGGLVSGPTLGIIGEGLGTSRSNPEVIAPLDKLKNMIGNTGLQPQVVTIRGRLRGQDMILQNARTTRSQNRLR